MKLVFVLTASVLLICACAGKPEVNTEALSGSGQTMVFYGTDRDRDKTDDPEKFYGLGRGSFEYGVTRVTANLQNDKTRVEAVEPQSRDQFLNKLDHALSAARSPTLFVFIHGYNRSFDQANRLVAEFAKRTDFPALDTNFS